MLLSLLSVAVNCDGNIDIMVEYYTSVNLPCDDYTLNYTTNNRNRQDMIKHKFWILPSNEIVDNQTVRKNIELSTSWENFSLTIQRINDADFGYYTCIIVTDNVLLTKSVRRGVNIDGPSFGDLDSKYRHNAMVGGIAAAIMFVLIGSTCLIWNFRFARKMDRQDMKLKVGSPYEEVKVENPYINAAFVDEKSHDITTESKNANANDEIEMESANTGANGIGSVPISQDMANQISHHF